MCEGAGVLADAIHDRGVIGLMRGINALQDSGFEGGRFVEFLPFKHSQGLTDDIGFVGITTGMDESIHELVEFGRQRDCHGETIVCSRILSRPGLR